MSKDKRQVVIFGGGNGSATTLRAMKRSADIFNLSAVVSMADSGGSSGRLRQEFNTLPAGDVLRAILALSSYGYRTVLRPMFYKNRFTGLEKLDGHNLGNLFLVLTAQYCGGDFVSAMRALEQAVAAQGTVYPATLDPAHLAAELDNGDIVRTEAALDHPAYDRAHVIKRVWLEPETAAYPGAIRAIEKADFLLFGPGSLYTSVIASLLPRGFKEAMARSKAKTIYIAGNKYELDGETGPTALHDFVSQLEQYLPRPIDAVVFNKVTLTPVQQEHYKEKGWAMIEYDPDRLREYLVYAEPFERQSGGLSADRLGRLLREAMT